MTCVSPCGPRLQFADDPTEPLAVEDAPFSVQWGGRIDKLGPGGLGGRVWNRAITSYRVLALGDPAAVTPGQTIDLADAVQITFWVGDPPGGGRVFLTSFDGVAVLSSTHPLQPVFPERRLMFAEAEAPADRIVRITVTRADGSVTELKRGSTERTRAIVRMAT